MSVPTSPALSAAREAFEQRYGSALWMWEMRRDLSDLLRLQHEASTTATVDPAAEVKVFDLDAFRGGREMACYDPDDHNPRGAA